MTENTAEYPTSLHISSRIKPNYTKFTKKTDAEMIDILLSLEWTASGKNVEHGFFRPLLEIKDLSKDDRILFYLALAYIGMSVALNFKEISNILKPFAGQKSVKDVTVLKKVTELWNMYHSAPIRQYYCIVNRMTRGKSDVDLLGTLSDGHNAQRAVKAFGELLSIYEDNSQEIVLEGGHRWLSKFYEYYASLMDRSAECAALVSHETGIYEDVANMNDFLTSRLVKYLDKRFK